MNGGHDAKGANLCDANNKIIKFNEVVDFTNKHIPDSFSVYVDGGSVSASDGWILPLVTGKGTNYDYGYAYYKYSKADNRFHYTGVGCDRIGIFMGPVSNPQTSKFNPGDNLMFVMGHSANFMPRDIQQDKQWHVYSSNTELLNDLSVYDYVIRGVAPTFWWTTNGNTWIDDIKFGYASYTNIYRDGTVVHSGYDSDFEDTSATDKAKPNKPTNLAVTKLGTNANLTWDGANDNGTTYNYTADSTTYMTKTKSALSAPKPVTLTTGMKGYAVVVDNNPNTVVTSATPTTTATTLASPLVEGNHYAHVASIDNAGNVSDTQTLNFDMIAPKIALTPNLTSGVSNQDLSVSVKSIDSESGVKSVTLPDGTVVNGDTATFNVTKNGVYTVKSIDNAGNETTQSIPIGGTGASVSIDKTAPTITATFDKADGWTNQNITVTVKATDTESGVDKLTLADGTEVKGDTATFSVKSNGTYRITAYDKAGNSSYKDIDISAGASGLGIDKLAPDLDVSSDTTSWTNKPITLTAKAEDFDSGIKSIILPDGTSVPGVLATYKVSQNGTYTFKGIDNAGNTTTSDIEVKIIDVNKPTLNLTIDDNATWTKDDVTINAKALDSESGIKSITLPDGKEVPSDSTTFKANGNGTYKFKTIDNAGNVVEQSIDVKCIDKTSPTVPDISGIASDGLDKWRNTDYIPSVKMSNTSTSSGTKEIQYQIVDKTTGKVIKDWSTFVTGKTAISNEGISNINFRTVSNSGVISDSIGTTVKIDKTKPVATATCDNSQWTNQGIGVNVTCNDTLSGIASVKLPDGKITTLQNATYLAMANGTYSFVITDNAGNSQTVSGTVSKMDTTKPNTLKINNVPSSDWMNTDYTPNIDVTSDGISSGIKEIDYRLIDVATGKVTKDWSKYTKGQTVISDEGITKMEIKAITNSGTESDISTLTAKIDKTKPVLTVSNITPNNSLKTGLDYRIDSSDALSGLVSVDLPNGTQLTKFPTDIAINKSGDFKVTAKDNAGNIQECTLTISDKLNSNRNNIESAIDTGIDKWKPNNESVPEDLKKIVEDSVGTGYNVTISDWNLQPSTENDFGNVTATVTVDDGNGNKLVVPVNKQIDKVVQTVTSAKQKLSEHIGDLIATNSTTKQDLIEQIKKYVINPDITVDIDNFDKKNSTMEASGVITGVATFTDKNGDSATLDLNLTITKLAETLEDAESIIKANIGKIKVDNDTTDKTILDQVKQYLYTDELAPSIKDFKIDKATDKATGDAKCTIVITNKEGKSIEIPFDGIIDKLSQTMDSAVSDINAHIGELVVDNNTTEADLITQISKYITNTNLKPTIDNFDKIKADYAKTGKIDFKLNLTDTSTNKSSSSNMDLSITKLVQTEQPIVVPYAIDSDKEVTPTEPTISQVVADITDGDFQQAKEDITSLPKTSGYAVISITSITAILIILGICYIVIKRRKRA